VKGKAFVTATFLQNTWYMGAWAHEVTAQPMSRRMLGVAMMFYRKSDDAVVALRDRCPHRFAPLSNGKVIDDCIQCPYHGLRFDASGRCVMAPLEERAPPTIRVQSFPVVERHNIIWFWPGDPSSADADLIPEFSYLTDVSFKHVFGMTHVNAHYELETDNLMDLSHVDMLHPPFSGVLSKKSIFKAYRDGHTVHANWFSKNAPNPSSLEHGPFPTGGEPIDQWLEMRWNAPAAMYLEVAVTRTGQPREMGYTMPGVHILTPETDSSTLYFWAGTLRATDQVPLDLFRADFVQTFEHEDRPMIENVAREMGDNTDLLAMKPLLLRSDAGSVLARRTMAELIAKEQAGISTEAVAAE
jgi:phenylpropionate dioxygenase-like ring-hydroxylating dioxygenase large terminal subunit